MTVLNGIVLYVLIWWTALFAILPFGTRPVEEADPNAGGWRGTPARPRLLMKALVTTVVAAVIWAVCFALVQSGWISFRSGWFALPET